MRMPPEVDPAWWTTATWDGQPLSSALHDRDVTRVFRFLKARGWSRMAIAAATGLSETRVREICQGNQRITSYEVLERVAEGLAIDRGLMGLAYTNRRLSADPSVDQRGVHDGPPRRAYRGPAQP